MSERVVVVGAGGFGREALDVLNAMNTHADRPGLELLGVLDDSPSEANIARLAARTVPYLGAVDNWLAAGVEAMFVVAVGAPSGRRAIAMRFEAAALPAATLVHPGAGLGSVAAVGPGTVICAGVQVSTNVRLGGHVHLNPNATIGHDAILDDYVSVNPAATVSGECRIGAEALIGAGAVVLPGLTVGAGAVVGASACVVRDVPHCATVKGVPAR